MLENLYLEYIEEIGTSWLAASLKLNIYHFEPQNFGGHLKQLAKNPEKCANDSFFKTENDPTKIEQFIRATRQIYTL